MKRLLPLLFLLLTAAHSYDGTGDSHVVNDPNKGSAIFSACMWVYATTWQAGGALLNYGNGKSASAGRGWTLSTQSSGAIRFDVLLGGSSEFGTTTATMSTSTWHSVCVTRSATNSNKVYIDGVLGGSDTFSLDAPTTQNSTDDIIVGQHEPADANGLSDLNAQVTEVAYWNVALTATEVGNIANKTSCPSAVETANLQAFLKLSEATPVDSSANAFSVTQNGNPALVSDPSGLPCGGGGGGSTGGVILTEDY